MTIIAHQKRPAGRVYIAAGPMLLHGPSTIPCGEYVKAPGCAGNSTTNCSAECLDRI